MTEERSETERVTQIAAAPAGWRLADNFGKDGTFKWEIRHVIAWVLVEYTTQDGPFFQQVQAVDAEGDQHVLANVVLYAPGELTDDEERERDRL